MPAGSIGPNKYEMHEKLIILLLFRYSCLSTSNRQILSCAERTLVDCQLSDGVHRIVR